MFRLPNCHFANGAHFRAFSSFIPSSITCKHESQIPHTPLTTLSAFSCLSQSDVNIKVRYPHLPSFSVFSCLFIYVWMWKSDVPAFRVCLCFHVYPITREYDSQIPALFELVCLFILASFICRCESLCAPTKKLIELREHAALAKMPRDQPLTMSQFCNCKTRETAV